MLTVNNVQTRYPFIITLKHSPDLGCVYLVSQWNHISHAKISILKLFLDRRLMKMKMKTFDEWISSRKLIASYTIIEQAKLKQIT